MTEPEKKVIVKRKPCFYCHGSKVNPGNTGKTCAYCYGNGVLDVVN
jgi:DnaJ-class molecular chaperone